MGRLGGGCKPYKSLGVELCRGLVARRFVRRRQKGRAGRPQLGWGASDDCQGVARAHAPRHRDLAPPQSDSAVRPESHTFLPLFPVEWANFLRLLQIWPMKTRAIRFRARRARVPTRLGSLRSERGNVWEIPKFIRAIVSG